MSRRALTAVLAVALAASAFVLPGQSAQASAANMPDTSAWVTNGDVHAVVAGNGRTYLGGTFDQVGPNTGFGVSLHAASGALPAGFASKVNGPVYAAVSDGNGGWYIGGDFTRVAGKSLHNAAYIRPDGTAGGWNPSPDLTVYAIAMDGNRIYIGGEFSSVRKSSVDGGGDARVAGLAATKPTDGGYDTSRVLPSIKPGVDALGTRLAVKALAVSSDGTRLYAGGTFTAVCASLTSLAACNGEMALSRLAAVNLGTLGWDATWAPQPDGPVAALQLAIGRLFVGGSFANIGGMARPGFAALLPGGAGGIEPNWRIQADGPVDSMLVADNGSSLFLGGSFTRVGYWSSGGIMAWSDRPYLAKLVLTVPGGIGDVNGNFRPSPDGAVLGMATSPDGSRLYAGGSFTTMNGAGPRFLASLDAATGAVDPGFNGMVAATVRAVATYGTTVYAGGNFTSVGGVIRRNVAALGPDGTLDPGFSADTDGEVNALVVSGNSLYIGGTFRNIAPYVNGKNRGLAKVNGTTGAPDGNFVVKIDSSVLTLGLAGDHLYVGGNFNSVKDTVGDQPRAKAASLNASTGTVELAWNPGPDKAIKDLMVSPDQTKIYLAGDFALLGNTARTRLAAVDPLTGAPTGWSPAPPDSILKMDVSADGSMVFVALGGRYGVGNRIQAWRTTSNQRVWDVEGDGDFQAVAFTNTLLYVGGHFNFLNKKADERQHLAALDPATGTVQPWGPSIGGVHGVLDLFVTPSHIWVAGEFDNIGAEAVGKEAIQGVARFTNLGDTPPITTPPTQPPTTTTTPATQPPAGGGGGGGGGGGNNPPVGPASNKVGYWMVGADGAVYGFGDAARYGSPTLPAGTNAVDLEPTPSGNGYWVVTDKGTVSSYGDARFFGAPAASSLAKGETVTSLSATPTGLGYWIFTSKGRVVNFGDAVHYGDVSKITLNGPVLDSIPTTTGRGYYMVASDGGIFTFGDAAFYGSTGNIKLNKPVQSLVPDPDGKGYWLVASDGGIFAFAAPFKGSLGDVKLNKPVTGMVRYADGYMMVGEDGGIFNFSNKDFLGSLGANPPLRPIVSVAALG